MPLFLNAEPQALTAAANTLEGLSAATVASNAAAAQLTTEIAPPAADDVSILLAHFFSGHGRQYQAHASQGATNHQDLIQSLLTSSSAYAGTETANHDSL
ncbi:hypothetical protein JK2ML_1183 [Mycobacterium leprae Kyoto-2]|uniref:PE domain-containing protein n=3 Tax=Mycobacterium leprae TaxID=1769 RepID=Q7AQ88_MYCLE|nr:PE family protein [Mycobacterium leprae]CAR71148.1 conserved hypothetical protein [Mycobacterium leprae Br4923]AAA62904.1 u1756a [Mycobacterium leprae]OAR19520.1 hypothetical protein A8144_14125 [Mycobacterium leprae 3125609]OAR19625.1 hypothetical protein A8144_13875 [Mycobacterium leprae 3125609]OAR20398.1 hypothetical protein A8144_10830 [Mycobacterium leprae 3125609]